MRHVLVALSALVFASAAQAKIATPADLPFVIEKDHGTVTVESDGRYRLERLVVIRINNDQGREAQSVQSMTYNSRAQKFELLEAATLNGPPEKAVRSPVPKKDIEIKETGELSQAFDSIKQVAVSYPQVKVGSRLVFKYAVTTLEIPIKGFWSMGNVIGGEAIEDYKFVVRSKLPLHHVINDREGRLRIDQKKTKAGTEITFSAHAPLMGVTIQEEMPFKDPEGTLSFWLSTASDWKSYAKDMIPIHENLLSKPLPRPLAEIRDKAAAEKTPQEKIERVSALVAQEFRYFGDWRRRHGGYVPRSLQEIVDSRYGDCKDLSLISTAIFRSLGFKSDMAWVFRGEIPQARIAYHLPVDVAFNHAIARVEADRVYWIDATNPVVYADGVYPDIAGRPSFVLSPSGARLDEIPVLDSKGAIDETKLTYDLQPDGTLKVDGNMKLKGRVAIGLTARAFYTPVETVNYEIIRAVANGGKILESSVGGFERGSRIVSDIEIPVKFTLSDIGLRTSAGFGFPLMRPDSVSSLLVETKERRSDLYLEIPGESHTQIEIRGVKKVGRNQLDCEFKTDFIELRRTVREIGKGVAIEDYVAVKKPIVSNAEMAGAKFAEFQKGVRDCYNRSAVILERR